jgi:3-oxoacyl-[acyl-carrier-protein] synthase II
VVTVKALLEQTVHPTINLENPEPDLGFHVPKKAEKHAIHKAISNSFGFGGHNASIILGKY